MVFILPPPPQKKGVQRSQRCFWPLTWGVQPQIWTRRADNWAAGALSRQPHRMAAAGGGGWFLLPSWQGPGGLGPSPPAPWDPRVTRPREGRVILCHNLRALQICISRHFSSQAARRGIGSALEMGWNELDPLRWGVGSTPKPPTPFPFPTPNPASLPPPSQPFLILPALISPSCCPAPPAHGVQDTPRVGGPGEPCGVQRCPPGPRSHRCGVGIILQPLDQSRQHVPERPTAEHASGSWG